MVVPYLCLLPHQRVVSEIAFNLLHINSWPHSKHTSLWAVQEATKCGIHTQYSNEFTFLLKTYFRWHCRYSYCITDNTFTYRNENYRPSHPKLYLPHSYISVFWCLKYIYISISDGIRITYSNNSFCIQHDRQSILYT